MVSVNADVETMEDLAIDESFKNDDENAQLTSVPFTETAEEYKQRIRSIRIIHFCGLQSAFLFSVNIPILLPYMQTLSKTGSTQVLGWIVASFSICQLVLTPLFGYWSNRRKQAREPMIVSFVITLIGMIIFCYARVFPPRREFVLLFARILCGVGSASFSVMRAFIAGATTLEERTDAMGCFSAVQAVGFILGPSLQSLFTFIGYPAVDSDWFPFNMYTAPIFLTSIVAIITLVLLVFVFTESRVPDVIGTEEDIPQDFSIDKVAAFVCIFAWLVVMFSVAGIESMATVLVEDMFAVDGSGATTVVAVAMLIVGLIALVAFIVVQKQISPRVSDRLILLGGAIGFLVVNLFMIPWGNVYPKTVIKVETHYNNSTLNSTLNATNAYNTTRIIGCNYDWCTSVPAIRKWQMIINYIAQPVMYAALDISTVTLYSKILGSKPQGVTMGIFISVGAIGRLLGPLIMTQLYGAFGPRVAYLFQACFCFVLLIMILVTYKRLVAHTEAKREDIQDIRRIGCCESCR